MTRLSKLAACMAFSALVLGSCKREATGQVAAVVGDDEITLQEINMELGDSQQGAQGNAGVLRQAALQRIVDRRLLVQSARDDGIDKQPDFAARQQQLEDALLAQLLRDKTARSAKVPSQAALDKFISGNPQIFADREILTLNQIRFSIPADSGKLRQLEQVHSLSAVADTLSRLSVPFEQTKVRLDTAQLDPGLLAKIKALPPSEPILLPSGGLLTASVIVGRQPSPITGSAAYPIALQLLRDRAVNETISQRINNLKSRIKIDYKAHFSR